MSADDLHDAIPADYLAGHPDAPEGADDGHLSVADGALTFSAEVITGMTIGRVAFAMPLDAVRSLSVLDRGTAETARPVLRAGAAAGAVGVFLATSRPLRERLLLVDLGEGTVAVFALTMAGAVRLRAQVAAVRPDLAQDAPEGPPADAVLTEIRDLLARQVALLERIAGRLAP
ncbi:MAG: hypothetical protein U0237_20605 [Thermoleophilia bacterium]